MIWHYQLSEVIDLVAEDVFAELKKEIESLSAVKPTCGTESMHLVVLETSQTDHAKNLTDSLSFLAVYRLVCRDYPKRRYSDYIHRCTREVLLFMERPILTVKRDIISNE